MMAQRANRKGDYVMRRTSLTVAMIAVLFLVGVVPARAQIAGPIQLIPVVVKAKGRAGTLWRSDLSITNLTSTAQTVTAAYFPEEQATLPPLSHTHTITLQPHQTVLVQDVVGSWFSQFGDNTKGALMVFTGQADIGDVAHMSSILRWQGEGEASPALAVSSRAYNAANPNATYGQTVPATLLGYFFGIASGKLTGVRQDSKFRTNIGVFNFSALTAPVQITVYDQDGHQLAQKTENVEAYSMGQWNLKNEFGVDGLTNGLVDVRLDPSVASQDPCGDTAGSLSPVLLAYYSKNDNTTGDAEFGIAQADWRDFAVQCDQSPMDGCSTAF